jgi:hypothetical protein
VLANKKQQSFAVKKRRRRNGGGGGEREFNVLCFLLSATDQIKEKE